MSRNRRLVLYLAIALIVVLVGIAVLMILQTPEARLHVLIVLAICVGLGLTVAAFYWGLFGIGYLARLLVFRRSRPPSSRSFWADWAAVRSELRRVQGDQLLRAREEHQQQRGMSGSVEQRGPPLKLKDLGQGVLGLGGYLVAFAVLTALAVGVLWFVGSAADVLHEAAVVDLVVAVVLLAFIAWQVSRRR